MIRSVFKYVKSWSIIGILRLVMGGIALVQGIVVKEYFLILVALGFLFITISNKGTCPGSCTLQSPKNSCKTN